MRRLTLDLKKLERYEIVTLDVSGDDITSHSWPIQRTDLMEIISRADDEGHYVWGDREGIINQITYAHKSAGFFTDPTFSIDYKEFTLFGRPLSFIAKTKILSANERICQIK